MPKQQPNPFQTFEISVPVEFHEAVSRYSQSGEGRAANPDDSPFPRMIDMWFLSVCIAAKLNLPPVDISGRRTRHMIDGNIFSQDPSRIYALQLIAIAGKGDIGILENPREIINYAHELAAAGLPRVIEMLEGDAEPIWNLSEQLVDLMDAS